MKHQRNPFILEREIFRDHCLSSNAVKFNRVNQRGKASCRKRMGSRTSRLSPRAALSPFMPPPPLLRWAPRSAARRLRRRRSISRSRRPCRAAAEPCCPVHGPRVNQVDVKRIRCRIGVTGNPWKASALTVLTPQFYVPLVLVSQQAVAGNETHKLYTFDLMSASGCHTTCSSRSRSSTLAALAPAPLGRACGSRSPYRRTKRGSLAAIGWEGPRPSDACYLNDHSGGLCRGSARRRNPRGD